ncbi:hypothetical protein ACQPYH_11800 [Kribbella sp. CA-245084]|uniref:hypothetical protein n=1 Tax=Kribbella sp. CA-245084 TaxID=3239940 RepID=UPI003D8C05F4
MATPAPASAARRLAQKVRGRARACARLGGLASHTASRRPGDNHLKLLKATLRQHLSVPVSATSTAYPLGLQAGAQSRLQSLLVLPAECTFSKDSAGWTYGRGVVAIEAVGLTKRYAG